MNAIGDRLILSLHEQIAPIWRVKIAPPAAGLPAESPERAAGPRRDA